MRDHPLNLLMNPRSIATVGAGNNPFKMGTIQALSIRKDGYQGSKAYRSVFDLPEPPDLALLIIPTGQVAPLLEDFGKLGTRRAIIISAGFKETGAAGAEAEEQLKAVAKRYGIRFLGPNCMGLINSEISLIDGHIAHRPARFVGAASERHLPDANAPYLPEGHPLQQGGQRGKRSGSGHYRCPEHGEDPQTRAIILYTEGLRDGKRFWRWPAGLHRINRSWPNMSAVPRCPGWESHTGSMAGPDYLYEGIFKQAGVIRTRTIEELYAHGWVLATQPPLKGRRVAVVTNSGGPGTAMAHSCSAGGLQVPPFSAALQEKIRALIPPYASAANPVDLTFNFDIQMLSVTIPDIIMHSGEVDALLLHGAMGSGFMKAVYPHVKDLLGDLPEAQFLEQFKHDLSQNVALSSKHGLPMLVSTFFDER